LRCPKCGEQPFPSRGHGGHFTFAKDPDTGRLEGVIMRFPCGHDAWINKKFRDKYGGKKTDPVCVYKSSKSRVKK